MNWNQSTIGNMLDDVSTTWRYRSRRRLLKVFNVSGWLDGIAGGGQQLLSQFMISDQGLQPTAHPPGLPESPLRLIKLDQDDTNNWLKMEPVCSPNDPYLTPFVATVSLFKRFSPIPRWTQQPADIMRVTERLHFSQMCGKLSVRWLFMATSFHPFSLTVPRGASAGGADEAHLCEMFSIWYPSHFRRWFILNVKLGRWKSALHQCSALDKKGNNKSDALRTEYRFGKKEQKTSFKLRALLIPHPLM